MASSALLLLSALALALASLPGLAWSQGGDYFKSPVLLKPGRAGPWVFASRGQVWPKPKLQKNVGNNFFVVNAAGFEFQITDHASTCDIIALAVDRYYKRTFPRQKGMLSFDSSHPWFERISSQEGYQGVLQSVEIVMKNRRGCEKRPHLDMDEHYEIKVGAPDEPKVARIISFSVWGILRGLETFSQLIYIADGNGGVYQVNSTQLMDQPRFSHRGVMLDSARHFLSKRVLFDNLDLMEMNKMNVFHWHLTDDSSFPYESLTFPNMSLKGAYRPYTHVYSQEVIREIVEQARVRGIRVIAEFDTPGHTQSWELGQPGLLARCYNGAGHPNGLYGPIDPIKEETYDFIRSFFKEVTTVFPDKYVHLGGDEVSLECWQSNPKLREYVQKHLRGDFRKLESEYIVKLLNIIASYPTKNGYIVWQEVFDNRDKVKNDTVVQVWKGNDLEWGNKLAEITRSGLRGLLSAPWYLNYISYGSDWVKYYNVEPLHFKGTEQEKKLIIGGEACIWGEFVNSVNLLPRLWPRASAVAERLWSPQDVRDVASAARRLEEHQCRMLQRGYPVEPVNGAGFCDVLWD